ncbi:ABC-F family ATP-binding cassette domain-containing protein [Geminicoccus roseus]|uniref:ABC-F family ATP-binding cassette domain-containing protein n=1 Tax=Geminicoccus roseus TaxID=404900 RepID=UPI0004097656|nr:ATP-binding cassette domain-containing protein [Geminicoccus roseus]
MNPPLLVLRSASLGLGRKRLFDQLDVSLAKGERVCLIGRNGTGKSTLMKVLAGMVELDSGERFLQPRTVVSYLPQEPDFSGHATAGEFVAAALPESVEPAMRRVMAETVLARVGIDPEQPTSPLSGGEARKISLAAALVVEPEVLLLDEPTNHLDIASIEWLEQELAAFPGALVIISHDRRLLSNISAVTWWLDRARIRVHDKGFSDFENWSEQVLAEEEANLYRLQKRIESEEHWLHRGVTARRKRNMGRLRRLQDLRMQKRTWVGRTGSVDLRMDAGQSSGTLVIEAKHIAKRFGDRVIVEDLSTRILKGDRIGLIGPNGVGKTTLLKMLTGELEPDSGTVKLGTNLTIARFDQTRAALDPDATPWTTLCPEGGDQVNVLGRWQHVVGYLRAFLFEEEQARTPIRVLSGGERNRLLLAKILAVPSNLLVLDEPTNDLDMDTLDLLQETLDGYEGTVMVVSHDRDFLDRVATSTIVFEPGGKVGEYAGGYSDWLVQRAPPPEPVKAKPEPDKPKGERPRRSLESRLLRELERLPAKMETAAGEIAALEMKLAAPDFYLRDPDGFASVNATVEAKRRALAAMEERWLELETMKEDAGL